MSVDTIYKVLLYPFIKESIASLNSMTDLSGKEGEAFMDKVEDFRFKGYAVCSDVTGALNGVIMMHHYPETAIAIGNSVGENLLNESHQYEEINQQLANALAEWGNTIVGRSTDFHGQYNLNYQFSAPYFVHDVSDMDKFLKNVKEVATVPITVEGVGRYYFNLLVRDVSYSAEAITRREKSTEVTNPHTKALPKTATILVVDDSSMIRKAIKSILSKQLGYENVVEADDGKAAIEMVEKGGIDFMFMDVVMGEVNGNDALNAIRTAGHKVPVVMLSSVTDKALIDKCRSYGISGFIFKPIQAQTGAEVLERYLKIE